MTHPHNAEFEVDARELLKVIDPLADEVTRANEAYRTHGDASGIEQLVERHPNMTPVLNMLLAPAHWTPEPWQICKARNPSYLNSLWIGSLWNLISLPSRFWPECLRPLLWGRPGLFLLGLFAVPLTSLSMFFFGLLGKMHAMPISATLARRMLVLGDEQAVLAARHSAKPRMFTMVPTAMVSSVTAGN